MRVQRFLYTLNVYRRALTNSEDLALAILCRVGLIIDR